MESKSNQIFPILSNENIKILQERFSFNIWEKVDNKNSAIRLVTSWATTKEAVFEFIQELKQLVE